MNKFILCALSFLALGGCVSTDVVTPSLANQLAHPRYISIINKKAIENNVPVDLAHSVIYTESNYKPKAFNEGAYGLGQIKCGTARGIGFVGQCTKLYEPEINLTYSFKYLRMALDIANNDTCHAASLYQSGLGGRAKKSPYCKKVLSNIEKMK